MSAKSATNLPLTPLETNININPPQKRTRKGGKSFDEVWTYVIMGNELNAGHYKATCYHCNKVWARGKSSILKAHLANECLSIPENINRYWCNKVILSILELLIYSQILINILDHRNHYLHKLIIVSIGLF